MKNWLKSLWHDGHSATEELKNRVVKASTWSFFSYLFDLIIRIASSLILTRLLFPEAYGLMAIATVVPTLLIMWSDVGLGASIIRYQGDNLPDYLSTAWAIQALRGFFLWVMIIIMAFILHLLQKQEFFLPHSIYSNPQLPLLIVVLGFSCILSGIESIKIHLAYRLLQVRRITLIDISSKLIGFLIMLGLCYYFRSVWILAFGSLSISFARTVLSHLFLEGPPFKLLWNPDFATDIFRSGKWIALSSFFSLVPLQGDRVMLGFFFSGTVLGQYSLALQILGAIQGLLSHNISNIVPTALGETFRTIPEKMKDRYYQMRFPIDLVTFCFVGIFMVSGPSVVSLFYDERYAPAGWMIQWLSLGLLALPFEAIIHAFPVAGKAHIYAYISMLQAGLLLICGLLGNALWGLPGMIAGIGCYRILCTIPLILTARELGWTALRNEFSRIYMLFIGLLIGWGITLSINTMRGA